MIMQVECSIKLRIVEVNPWEDSRWEAFVVSHPDGTIYHHPAWLKALECEYRQRAVFLACEDSDGTLLGILPLLYTRGLPLSGSSPLAGPRLSSLPRTPLAGPLAVDGTVTAMILREAVRRVNAESRFRLQIKMQGGELSSGIPGIVRKPWRVSYVVRLPGSPGQNYTVPNREDRSKIKRAVNKALANGVRTRIADTEADLRAWYVIYLETMRRNFVAARSYRFFLALWKLMHPKGMMRLLLAEHDTGSGPRIIAGYVIFCFRHTVTYAFGASRASDFALRPNDMILWEAIQKASLEGYRFVDLGEVPDGDVDHARFKSKWGADAVRLYRYYFPDFPDSEPSEMKTGHVPMALVKRIWQHTPLAMTAWLGDRIYGYL
jgi:hypothetical protein